MFANAGIVVIYKEHLKAVAYLGGINNDAPLNGINAAQNVKRKSSLCLFEDHNGQKQWSLRLFG